MFFYIKYSLSRLFSLLMAYFFLFCCCYCCCCFLPPWNEWHCCYCLARQEQRWDSRTRVHRVNDQELPQGQVQVTVGISVQGAIGQLVIKIQSLYKTYFTYRENNVLVANNCVKSTLDIYISRAKAHKPGSFTCIMIADLRKFQS